MKVKFLAPKISFAPNTEFECPAGFQLRYILDQSRQRERTQAYWTVLDFVDELLGSALVGSLVHYFGFPMVLVKH